MAGVTALPAFRFVTVHRPVPDAVLLRWALEPHSWDMSDIAFVIFRASTPQGPWEDVGTAQEGTWTFTDYGVISPFVARQYYYILRAVSKSGKGYKDSSWVATQPEQDHIASELIRKKLLYLTTRGGSQAAILIRKTWGARCSRCLNYQKMQASDPDCPNCYGTGYTAGYTPPVYLPALLNPAKKAIVDAGVIFEPRQTYAEVGYMPLVHPDDLFVDVRQNIRYTIKDVQPFMHRNVTVAQTLTLTIIDESDIRYALPVPSVNENDYTGRSWDLVQPRKTDWMLKNVADYAAPGRQP